MELAEHHNLKAAPPQALAAPEHIPFTFTFMFTKSFSLADKPLNIEISTIAPS